VVAKLSQTDNRFTTEALVIREMKVGESDRLVTLFTRDYGIIKAFASGAKNIKSKKGSATSLLTYGSFTIKNKNGSLRIYEATPISVFFKAGCDIEVLALSQYFCELANEFAIADVRNEELLRLILNSLHFLTKEGRYPPLIKAITELRVAVISGYAPDLVACDDCGKFEDAVMFFNVYEGFLRCGNCPKDKGYKAVDRTILTAMRHIVYSQFKSLYSFEIPNDKAKILSDITGAYISVQTDHKFSTLEFYNSIKEQ
jgi:DNA repair protein RecO (recombination protein O)